MKQNLPETPEILTPGTADKPILNFSLKAYDGEVVLKGLHFVIEAPGVNTEKFLSLTEVETAALYTYELYDRLDRMVAQTKAQAGRIYFDLGAEDYRLTGTENFTVKVDLPEVNGLEQSWRWLRIALDKTYTGNGIQAINPKTGNVVAGVVQGQIGAWPSSSRFINAATTISLGPAQEQPPKVEPSLGGQEFYRFMVSAGKSGSAEIEKVTLQAVLEGMEFTGDVEARVVLVKADGSLNFRTPVTDEVNVELIDNDSRKALIHIDFREQLVLQDESNTYAVLLNRTRKDDSSEPTAYRFNLLTDSQKSTTRDAALLKTASNLVWSDLPGLEDPNRFMRGFLASVDTSTQVFTSE